MVEEVCDMNSLHPSEIFMLFVEMDPHGADLRGNPMGGMLYSTAFSATGAIEQTPDWTQFVTLMPYSIEISNTIPVDLLVLIPFA